MLKLNSTSKCVNRITDIGEQRKKEGKENEKKRLSRVQWIHWHRHYTVLWYNIDNNLMLDFLMCNTLFSVGYPIKSGCVWLRGSDSLVSDEPAAVKS